MPERPPPAPPPPPPPPPSSGSRGVNASAGGWYAPVDHDPDNIITRPVRWGIGHAVIGLLVAYASALVGTVILVAIVAEPDQADSALQANNALDEMSVGALVTLQTFLWVGYVGAALLASHRKGNGAVLDYGWKFRLPDSYQGLVLGAGLQIVAVPVIYVILFLFIGERDVSAAARELTDLATTPLDAALLVLVIAIGAPLVEELFFRGLLLRSLQRRFGPWPAMLGSSVVFAGVHLQLLQFPALFMFGMVAAWLTVRSGRLGPAVWAHIGFNSVTVVALLIVG